MGNFCYCSNQRCVISNQNSQRDSINIDISSPNNPNDTERIDEDSPDQNNNGRYLIPEIKNYFNKDSKMKLSTQRSRREASYDFLVKRLLEEKTKKPRLKRKSTNRNPAKIREIVTEIKLEYEIQVERMQDKDPDAFESTINTTFLDNEPKRRKQSLSSHEIQFIINNLCEKKLINDNDQLNDIINMFESHTFNAFKCFYKKGSKKQYLFIIESGCVEYMIDDMFNYLIAGDCFSTDILERNSEIDCSVRTVEVTKLFSLYLNDEVKRFFTLQDFHLKIKDEKIKLLLQTPIFLNLELAKMDKLANRMKKYWLAPKAEIIDEKEKIECCYFLIRGCVQCQKKFEIVKKINPITLFCEISLFCYAESNYCYLTETEVILYKLDYKDIKEVLGDKYINEIIQKLFVSMFKRSEQFNRFLGMKNFSGLFSMFKMSYYPQKVVSSTENKKISLVICGRLLQRDSQVIVANPGDLFGELILQQTTESIEIISEDECVVYEAGWYDILKSLKTSCDQQITLYSLMKLLKKFPIFQELSDWKLFQIADSVKLHTYKDNHKILKNGPQSNKMFIIRNGKVRGFINNYILKDFENNESFGDIQAYEKKNGKPQSFVSIGKTECYIIEKDIYEEIIDFHYGKALDKIFEGRDLSFAFSLEDLYFIREIGAGSYGKVCLVHNKKTTYAAKTVEIKNCKHQRLLRYYVNEKNITTTLNHPFIVKLINTFKTNHHLYFLLEYIDGLTVSSYIRLRNKGQIRNMQEMVFIAACLFSVTNYLQRMRIIHRDIKPSNCIIDRGGYLKVIDFGVAKDMTGKDQTTTVLGTTHYISPEMIAGKGYSFSTDFWSIGILLYKFFFGYFPFGHDEADAMKIYDGISNAKLVLPSDKKNSEVNVFFQGILTKNPAKRINCLRAVKGCELFKSFDFDQLQERTLKSPIVIDLKKVEIDFTNESLSLKTYVENELLIQGESDYFSSSKSNELIADF